MSDPNVLASEKIGIVGTLDPATVTTEVFTDVIDMSKQLQVLGIALLGNMASDNVVFRAVACDSAGNNVQAMKTKTLTGSASGNDNTQLKIGVRGTDLLEQATYNRYIKFGILNSGGAGGPAAIVVIATDPKYGPAKDQDLDTVTTLNALD